jgi:hypothetical protein
VELLHAEHGPRRAAAACEVRIERGMQALAGQSGVLFWRSLDVSKRRASLERLIVRFLPAMLCSFSYGRSCALLVLVLFVLAIAPCRASHRTP